MTKHTPSVVVQESSIEPYSVVNSALVPLGTGLLNLSAILTVSVAVTPSVENPPGMIKMLEDKLMEFWSGRPVLTIRTSEIVEMMIVLPAPSIASIDAMTRTEVATSPEVTKALAKPSASLSPVGFSSTRPPASVERANETSTPSIGFRLASMT